MYWLVKPTNVRLNGYDVSMSRRVTHVRIVSFPKVTYAGNQSPTAGDGYHYYNADEQLPARDERILKFFSGLLAHNGSTFRRSGLVKGTAVRPWIMRVTAMKWPQRYKSRLYVRIFGQDRYRILCSPRSWLTPYKTLAETNANLTRWSTKIEQR